MKRPKTINVGIIGLGRAGWGMICNELDGHKGTYRVVGACDLIPERRRKFEDRYPGATAYNSYRDLVADSAVELVVVASRSCDHAVHTIAALKAGKSVFVEKPMSDTYADAGKMKRAADRSRGKLYVRHNRRLDPDFLHVREIVKSGILGKVFEIKLRRNSYERRNDWQTLLRFGGGQLLNWGAHIIDHALCLLNSPCVDLWSDLRRVAAAGDAEDHIRIIFRGENGRVVDMEISGGSAISEPEYLVSGSKGALKCSGNRMELRYLDPGKKLPARRARTGTPEGWGSPDDLKWIEKTIAVRAQGPDSKKDIWGHLYGAVRDGKKFPIGMDQAMAVMEVVAKVSKGTQFERG